MTANKIVIAGSPAEGMHALRAAGQSLVNVVIITPQNWRSTLRGRVFTEADIIWGSIPEGICFGPDFWNYLHAILATTPS